MLIRKQRKGKAIRNHHKIGPDEMRFQVKKNINNPSSHFTVRGIISHVGLDFVDILEEDCMVTVLTNRIKHIKWLDKKREINHICQCRHQGNCQCIELEPFIGDGDEQLDEDEGFFDESCPHCHKERRDGCHQRFTCFCDHAIPFCDDQFKLRLAGLNDDLNFELMQHKGSRVEIEID
jgi:hypothetical protein